MCNNKAAGEKHDEVIVAHTPRVGMIFCLLGILVTVLIMIKPDGLRETSATPNEIFWLRIGGPFFILACVYGFLFFWKACLILRPNEILIQGRFSTKRILLVEVNELLWGCEKALPVNGIFLRLEGSNKLCQLDSFTRSADYRKIVRYLRESIPLGKQVGWKEYYLRNRYSMKHPLDVEKQANALEDPTSRKLVLYMLGACGLACLVVITCVMFGDDPWVLSGIMFFSFFVLTAFVLWPGRQNVDSGFVCYSIAARVVVVLLLSYGLFMGLAALWEWFSADVLRLAGLPAALIFLGGFIAQFVFLARISKYKSEKRRLIREAEEAKYEKYAELLLPPELER